MKLAKFTLIAASPVLIGLFYALLSAVPYLGRALYYFLPLVMLFYWYWTGRAFFLSGLPRIKSLLFVHALGIFGLFIYILQHHALTGPLNEALSFFSTLFTAPISTLTLGLAGIFEPVEGAFTQVSLTVSEILSVALYMLVFLLGYSSAKKSTGV